MYCMGYVCIVCSWSIWQRQTGQTGGRTSVFMLVAHEKVPFWRLVSTFEPWNKFCGIFLKDVFFSYLFCCGCLFALCVRTELLCLCANLQRCPEWILAQTACSMPPHRLCCHMLQCLPILILIILRRPSSELWVKLSPIVFSEYCSAVWNFCKPMLEASE